MAPKGGETAKRKTELVNLEAILASSSQSHKLISSPLFSENHRSHHSTNRAATAATGLTTAAPTSSLSSPSSPSICSPVSRPLSSPLLAFHLAAGKLLFAEVILLLRLLFATAHLCSTAHRERLSIVTSVPLLQGIFCTNPFCSSSKSVAYSCTKERRDLAFTSVERLSSRASSLCSPVVTN
ncbi:hypothetical protein Ahy_A05g024812 isoform E [Arachis hypogaea]|uniref:Uncharacterized protein n=1 Tax=Arachis hypogaea TaxID=3818 RepID=A0A445D7H2_ARAHY|nr:hypothetical protein Ahy_A05g024812 isoform E [Arachis hypogaea]